MLSIGELMRWLGILSALLDVLLIVKFSMGGLSEVYRWFTRFLIYDLLATSLLVVTLHTSQYMVVLICYRQLYWILTFAVCLETQSLLLSDNPRLCGRMRWTVIAAAAVSVLVMIALVPGLRRPATLSELCRNLVAMHRTLMYVLAAAAILPLLVLPRLRVRPSRDLVTHAILFAALISVDAGYGLARDLLGAGVWTAALARLVLWNLCLTVWVFSTATVTRSLRARTCV